MVRKVSTPWKDTLTRDIHWLKIQTPFKKIGWQDITTEEKIDVAWVLTFLEVVTLHYGVFQSLNFLKIYSKLNSVLKWIKKTWFIKGLKDNVGQAEQIAKSYNIGWLKWKLTIIFVALFIFIHGNKETIRLYLYYVSCKF